MDLQVQELIDTIKKEGVASAEEQKAAIIEAARKEADELVAKAKAESRRLMEEAKSNADRFRATSEEALTQSGRDLLLRLEQRITAIFDELIKAETRTALSDKGLEAVLVALVGSWAGKRTDELEVLLSSADIQKLEKGAYGKLAEFLKKGLTVRPLPHADAGFRIGEKGGSVFYDFTSEGVASLLAEFLNPKLAELIREAAKKRS